MSLRECWAARLGRAVNTITNQQLDQLTTGAAPIDQHWVVPERDNFAERP